MRETVSVDRDTGEVVALHRGGDVAGLRAEVTALQDEVARLKDALVFESTKNGQLNSQIQALKANRNRRRELDPFAADGERVFEFWNRILKGGKAREFGEKRWAAVRARLNAGYTVEDHFAAIIGASLIDEGFAGRENMQELEYIARNEKHMDRFITDGRRLAEDQMFAMVKTLVHHYHGAVIADADGDKVKAWFSPCPAGCADPVGLLRLTVGFQASGDLVELQCRAGCAPKVVRDRLREMFAEIRAQEKRAA